MRTSPEGPERARVLVVEDEDVVRDVLARFLSAEGYRVNAVPTGEEGMALLRAELFDVVLLDLNLPGIGGMEVLSAAPTLQTDAHFIVMTAFGTVDTAVEAMKLGAFDYVNKPFQAEELLLTLERAVQDRETRRRAAQGGGAGRGPEWAGIVGESSALRRVFELVERVAPTRATVLITGETGTGKELVAQAIHRHSGRASGPFVAVNCSALPETLLESELFGHTKGSFTGAIADKRGLFEEADGGTLFLDEISTISAAIQIKLLRVLQERRVKRVGGTRPIDVDFRLLAATNVPLQDEVREGRFRADLHYRLNVFPVHVPPLRERRGDVPLLARYFRERFARENDIPCPAFTPETLERMSEHPWAGNVRELENFVERAMIMHAGSPSVPFDAAGGGGAEAPARRDGAQPGTALLDRAEDEAWTLADVEREHILRVLRRTGGHRANAAEVLGIHPRTLTRKLREYEAEGRLPAGVAGDGEG